VASEFAAASAAREPSGSAFSGFGSPAAPAAAGPGVLNAAGCSSSSLLIPRRHSVDCANRGDSLMGVPPAAAAGVGRAGSPEPVLLRMPSKRVSFEFHKA